MTVLHIFYIIFYLTCMLDAPFHALRDTRYKFLHVLATDM